MAKRKQRGSNTGDGTVTMRDVAQHVGMSMMTVSRVLNNPSSVREETRDRVMAAVEALGYRPNISARSLAASRSYLLGLIYDNPSSAYMSQLLIGALETCREAGYHLVVQGFGDTPGSWAEEVAAMVKGSNLDGVVIPPPVCDHPQVLEALRQNKTPHVRISPGIEVQESSVVYMDDRRAAAEITHLLIDTGHEDIAFIMGHPNQESSRLRYEGFAEAMKEAGLPIRPTRVVQGYYSYKSGFTAAETLLAGAPPTAIFASNDDMAAAVYANAQKHGLRIPRDLSVVGFDDTPTASILWPALTTVRQPIAAMASEAVSMLVRQINATGKPKPDLRELDFEVMERDSVDVSPGHKRPNER